MRNPVNHQILVNKGLGSEDDTQLETCRKQAQIIKLFHFGLAANRNKVLLLAMVDEAINPTVFEKQVRYCLHQWGEQRPILHGRHNSFESTLAVFEIRTGSERCISYPAAVLQKPLCLSHDSNPLN
jgi:hypothetical protein